MSDRAYKFLYFHRYSKYLFTDKPLADPESKFGGIKYEDKMWIKYMWWYFLIGLIWVTEFILAAHQFVIVQATVMWYYTR